MHFCILGAWFFRGSAATMPWGDLGFMEAGRPGLAHTPFARVLVSALLDVKGRFTAEITCGHSDPDSTVTFAALQPDTAWTMAPS